ncbi:MAG: hypothetical protein LBT01_07210 [Spirochaetaceae bacterium]|nr:hypothetical protein [Spirochaetaceae bacterium]
MKFVNVEEYLKHEFTPEETAERVADIRRIHAEIHQAELEDPLPDDFIEYCKGRKFRPKDVDLVQMGLVTA